MRPEDLDFHLLFVRARVPVSQPLGTVTLNYPRSDYDRYTLHGMALVTYQGQVTRATVTRFEKTDQHGIGPFWDCGALPLVLVEEGKTAPSVRHCVPVPQLVGEAFDTGPAMRVALDLEVSNEVVQETLGMLTRSNLENHVDFTLVLACKRAGQ